LFDINYLNLAIQLLQYYIGTVYSSLLLFIIHQIKQNNYLCLVLNEQCKNFMFFFKIFLVVIENSNNMKQKPSRFITIKIESILFLLFIENSFIVKLTELE
jgi:hypothetical protein